MALPACNFPNCHKRVIGMVGLAAGKNSAALGTVRAEPLLAASLAAAAESSI